MSQISLKRRDFPDSLESLRARHAEIEDRLERLERLRSLSPEEQYERAVLKKRKLVLKDQIRRAED